MSRVSPPLNVETCTLEEIDDFSRLTGLPPDLQHDFAVGHGRTSELSAVTVTVILPIVGSALWSMFTPECQELSILGPHADLARSVICSERLHGEIRGKLDILDDGMDTLDKIHEVVLAIEYLKNYIQENVSTQIWDQSLLMLGTRKERIFNTPTKFSSPTEMSQNVYLPPPLTPLGGNISNRESKTSSRRM